MKVFENVFLRGIFFGLLSPIILVLFVYINGYLAFLFLPFLFLTAIALKIVGKIEKNNKMTKTSHFLFGFSISGTIFPIVIIVAIIFNTSFPWGCDVIKTLPAPGGKYKAVIAIYNGGATTSFAPEVFIYPINKSHRCRGRKRVPELIFAGYGTNQIDIEWKNDSTLLIILDEEWKHHRKYHISTQRHKHRGFQIKYEERKFREKTERIEHSKPASGL